MSRVAVEGWNHVPVGVPSFASRVKWLETKLELGSLHLGLSFPFYPRCPQIVFELSFCRLE